MSIIRALKILRKDLRLGPRSPIFMWALIYPVVITLVLQGVFGGLFEPRARLGIVDQGSSGITDLMSHAEGIDVTLLKSVPDLKRRVEGNDLDAGLVLKAGFDTAMRSGRKPLLEFYIGGESLASNRIVLAVTTLDALRRVNGNTSPVEVEINTLGDAEALSLTTRLVPMMVLFALLIAGLFVPAFGLVEERENRTLGAVLITPVRLSEVLAAKAGLGIILAVLMAYVTLLLNGALGPRPAALVIALVVAGVMSAEFGLIYGTVAKDIKALFTLMKTLNVFLLAPVIFYIFPDWPQWIAKIFPTYWLINPIFELTIKGAGLSDVAPELGIALGICVFLAIPVWVLKRRMQATLSAG
ncbi:MAG: ABC transporter permease [Deltaproteobacteria bacterium]|nr:ABC transporter permease [Deltaproteobacteria bacterium]